MRRSSSFRFALFAMPVLPACAAAIVPTPAAPAAPPVVPGTAASVVRSSPPETTKPPLDARTQRLVRLCALWGNVRYHHPWVVEGAVDWDSALVEALPRALAATNDDELAAAVTSMTTALHDPATRVERSPVATPPATTPPVTPSSTVDGVLVVHVAARGWQGVDPEVSRVVPEIEKAPLLVLDLRASTDDDAWGAQLVVDKIAARLPSHDSTGITERFVEHRGYQPQSGVTSGGYETLLAARLPPTFAASTKPHPSKVVFVTNTRTGVPNLAWAMQRVGDAVIVLQGALGPDEFAAAPSVPVADGYVLHVRQAELVDDAPRADVELPASAADADIIEVALRAAHEKRKSRTLHAAGIAAPRASTWRPDATYANEPYPSRERRVLSLFRFWSVIHYFYPYLPLMGDAWDDALAEFLPRFEQASDAHEYVMAVAELAAKIPDGHVGVWGSKEMRSLFGAARQPFEAQMVEGHPTVTSLLGDASLAATGLAVGDVIVSVDGEEVATRMSRLSKYITASTEAWRGFRTLRSALSGDAGSTMKLVVRGGDGKTPTSRCREATARRSPIAQGRCTASSKTASGTSISTASRTSTSTRCSRRSKRRAPSSSTCAGTPTAPRGRSLHESIRATRVSPRSSSSRSSARGRPNSRFSGRGSRTPTNRSTAARR
jgi:hypothetical protein